MFLLLPLLLAAYYIYRNDKRIIPIILLGVIVAVVVCGFRAFFLYSHRIVPYSFAKNVIYLLIRQNFLPVLLVYGIFFVWSKDEVSFKIDSFFPLMMSFYALYLPYNILSTSEHVITSFPIFIKPAIFAIMILSLALFIRCIAKSISEKKNILTGIWGVAILLNLLIPAFLEGMYILDMNYAIILILSAAYCAVTPIVYLLCRFGYIKKN